jgi:hypothetical protein
MGKLKTPDAAGFNAGDSYKVQYIRLDKIITDPEISGLYVLNEKIVDAICQSIIKDGFHKEQPVTLWGKTLVDGHQRYAGAKKAGLVEIPYIEKNFDSREEAILYSLERQSIRRNLSSKEILYAAKMLPSIKAKNGEGRSAEIWAERLGVSLSTIYRANSILKNASEEDIQAVMNNESSIMKTYNKNKKPKEVEITVNNAHSLPANVYGKLDTFLKGVVILLVESKQKTAADLLINHYINKNNKRGFYDSLPETISAQLPRLPLVSGTLIDP